ncbi:hypothetical protein M9H77_24063 [Catharanthus roseus]|uniref:Uncharacterized protein n=1 Tax=Catharanthus roseus TaxID=4058 RepID=A0ACC0AWK5_CATRO|nr:hypothetical protein M9H77_24063 [Catharanthus roseus]
MGNCIVLQKNVIKIIKPDGETLEYKAPIKVRQVLSEFAGHAISDKLPVIRHLHPEADMIGGREYYLLPPAPVVPPQTGKSKITFPKPDEAAAQETGVVRIKLVISKQELKAMLQKGGVTVSNMIPELQNEEITNGVDSFRADDKMTSTGWKPMLESIPEGN